MPAYDMMNVPHRDSLHIHGTPLYVIVQENIFHRDLDEYLKSAILYIVIVV
jgi:hypothetical protein